MNEFNIKELKELLLSYYHMCPKPMYMCLEQILLIEKLEYMIDLHTEVCKHKWVAKFADPPVLSNEISLTPALTKTYCAYCGVKYE